MSTTVASAGRSQTTIFLCLVVFIGFVGHSLMITIFTPMLLTAGHGFFPFHAAIALRTFVLGVLLALYPLGQLFGAPLQGALSDRYGRKPILLFTLALTAFGYAVILLSLAVESLLLLGIARLVIGLSEANVVIAQSAIADMTRAEERGRLFGYVYMSISLAYVLGPLAGGKLADPGLFPGFGYATPFWFVFALILAMIYWCAKGFHESHVAGALRKTGYLNTLRSFLSTFTDKRVRVIYLTNFLLYLALSGYFRAYPIYFVSEFNMGVSRLSEYIAYAQLPLVVANLGLVGFLTHRFAYKTLTTWFALLAAAFMIAIGLSRSLLWIVLALPGAATAIAVCLPSCAALLSKSVEESEQGRIMGSNQSLQLGAELIAGLIVGTLAGISVSLPLPLLAIAGIAAAFILSRSSIPATR